MELISDEYVKQLKQLHSVQVWGASGYSHARTVFLFRKRLGAKTILDFGCGRGTLKSTLISQYRIDPNLIYEYDPAIEGKDQLLIAADLLVATDVLEHIEENMVFRTLSYLRELCLKGAFFTIDLKLSKVSLPDGRNAHIFLKSSDWWLDNLKKHGFRYLKHMHKKNGIWVWCR